MKRKLTTLKNVNNQIVNRKENQLISNKGYKLENWKILYLKPPRHINTYLRSRQQQTARTLLLRIKNRLNSKIKWKCKKTYNCTWCLQHLHAQRRAGTFSPFKFGLHLSRGFFFIFRLHILVYGKHASQKYDQEKCRQ